MSDVHLDHQQHLLELLGRDAERRQIVARDIRKPAGQDLVVLDDGAAPTLRDACRAAHLVCPLADCATPALTTVGGTRRHHFRHLQGGLAGHGPERLAHQLGKARLAAWVARTHPGLHVAVEQHVESGQVADVLVTSPISGKRIVLEVQCSPLTVDAWQARHDRYRRVDIIDVWLWWARRPWLRHPRSDGEQLSDLALRPATLEAVTAAGLRWLWFDPDTQILAAAVTDQEAFAGLRPGGHAAHMNRVGILPFELAGARLGADGLHHPTLDRLDTTVAELAAARARKAAGQAAQTRSRPLPSALPRPVGGIRYEGTPSYARWLADTYNPAMGAFLSGEITDTEFMARLRASPRPE